MPISQTKTGRRRGDGELCSGLHEHLNAKLEVNTDLPSSVPLNQQTWLPVQALPSTRCGHGANPFSSRPQFPLQQEGVNWSFVRPTTALTATRRMVSCHCAKRWLRLMSGVAFTSLFPREVTFVDITTGLQVQLVRRLMQRSHSVRLRNDGDATWSRPLISIVGVFSRLHEHCRCFYIGFTENHTHRPFAH